MRVDRRQGRPRGHRFILDYVSLKTPLFRHRVAPDRFSIVHFARS